MKNAVVLGFSGLIPFIALLAATIFGPMELRENYALWLSQYAAIICTFVGAFHWGIALHSDRIEAETWRFAYSVMPALFAWLALQLPTALALRSLAACLIICLAVDALLQKQQSWPQWFLRLRISLTVIAATILLAASMLIQKGNALF